jgi:putative PIG3 family NAD(P)H quinone oxidoreductase
MGLEAAGTIAELGEGVDHWNVGDRVCALLPGGGYAERASVDARHLLAIPEDLRFEDAAALPEVFLTAFLNIYIEADAQPGEWLLVHAAASGVGTAALQLAKLFGNPVIGTASGSKLASLEKWEPARLVDRRTESFRDVVAEVTDGRGVDVILDPVGANYFEDNLEALAPCGRLVNIGLLSGLESTINLGRLLRNRLRVIGSVLRPRTDDEKADIIAHFRERAWPHVASGELTPVIDKIFPMPDAEAAQDLLATNETIGKLVLSLSGEVQG